MKNKRKYLLGIESLVLSVLVAVNIAFIGNPQVKEPDIKKADGTLSDSEISENSEGDSDLLLLSAKKTTAKKKTAAKKSTTKKKTTAKKKTTTKKTASKKTTAKKTATKKTTAKKTTVKKTTAKKKTAKKMTFTKNVYLDALIYTGYNYKKTVKDNPKWNYVLCAQKRGMGWLSKITYGVGSSGYEKTKKGKPDIKKFQRGGLVCASYVTYVYFNYLPNVAKIKTSKLAKPKKSYCANDWYIAAQKWVKKGYSKKLKYTAKSNGNLTVFTPKQKIPIGSIVLFTDFKNRNNHCTHVCIYAGEKNGYHWVTHVGNANGPEFCAMERMSCGPDPQWPLAVISTPNCLGLKW